VNDPAQGPSAKPVGTRCRGPRSTQERGMSKGSLPAWPRALVPDRSPAVLYPHLRPSTGGGSCGAGIPDMPLPSYCRCLSRSSRHHPLSSSGSGQQRQLACLPSPRYGYKTVVHRPGAPSVFSTGVLWDDTKEWRHCLAASGRPGSLAVPGCTLGFEAVSGRGCRGKQEIGCQGGNLSVCTLGPI
jgi:hypothetical protein